MGGEVEGEMEEEEYESGEEDEFLTDSEDEDEMSREARL
jgi:hypothetical protein